MTTKRILIVDDHEIVADAMRSFIEEAFGERKIPLEVFSFKTIKACAALLLSDDPLDLIMLDLSLPDLPRGVASPTLALQLMKTLDAFGTTPVLVVSGSDDHVTIEQCRLAGARGFLSKGAAAQRLIFAVDSALEPGEFFSITDSFFSPPAKRFIATAPSRPAPLAGSDIHSVGLTPRQLDVLKLMVDGRSNKEIAARLDLSEGTVKIHVRFVLEKLGIESRLQAKEALEARNIELPNSQDQAA